jgi:hypothetical protein
MLLALGAIAVAAASAGALPDRAAARAQQPAFEAMIRAAQRGNPQAQQIVSHFFHIGPGFSTDLGTLESYVNRLETDVRRPRPRSTLPAARAP